VKRNGETWDASADDLSKLPDDIRPFVQQIIGGSPGQVKIRAAGADAGANNGAAVQPWIIHTAPGGNGQWQFTIPSAPNAPGQLGNLIAQPKINVGGSITSSAAQNSPDLQKRLEQLSDQLEKTQQELKLLRESIPAGDGQQSGKK
jgi:hypothetical protein